MSKRAKRERQRLNREARREAELTASKRRRRLKTVRNALIVLLPLAIVFAVIQLRSNDEAGAITCDDAETPPPKEQPYTAPPPTVIDPTMLYTATIETTCGVIELQLDPAVAPVSVNNFVFLAQEGFYNDLSFVRAAADFVVQAGSPSQTNSGAPGYTVMGEVPPEGVLQYDVGTVAFAKGPDEPVGTAGSQFFIVTASGSGLQTLNTPPYQYALIGQVTEGLKVAQKIESFAPPEAEGGDGPPTETVVIKKITITETPSAATSTTVPGSVPAESAPPAS